MTVQASLVIRLAARSACLPALTCFSQRTSVAATARRNPLVSMCMRHYKAGEVHDCAG
jgi:hypothetical protein